ncbi:4'-phosphopantetheinyl transferase family protein [Streptomyces sp. NPDC048111]|uniref:4'-phosphopantetheinyl transferase family protein n=1 Tax=Streptomyces sp. NPDC048111 TaxID=3365500 RepID=UPI0037191733
MTVPREAAVGPPVEFADGSEAAWWQIRQDLRRRGSALLWARMSDLRAKMPEGEELRTLLGRDWTRYFELSHAEVRDLYAASRLLLKYAAGAVLRCDPLQLELTYGPTGRPYLRGFDQIDISLSHTGDLLLVGLTTRGLIGVDAERMDRPLYRDGLDRHVCTPYELITLAALDERERNSSLVRLWTLKEAYSKAIGQGMNFRFTEFGFGPDGRPVQVQRPDGTVGTGDEWGFCTFVIDDEYCVSAAVYDAGFGSSVDTEITTMLDQDCVDALSDALPSQE